MTPLTKFTKQTRTCTLCCLSSGRANRLADPGAAAFPVPSVLPADPSGPGPADQRPPKAATEPASGHPAHHPTCFSLHRFSQQPLSRQPKPDHSQHQHQLGKAREHWSRTKENAKWLFDEAFGTILLIHIPPKNSGSDFRLLDFHNDFI